VELQRLDHLGVAEVQHRRPLLDHRDAGAEGGEHRRILHADHAGADDHHRSRNPPQLENAVGVEHVLVVELDLGGTGRLRAGGDHDVLGGDGVAVAPPLALHGDGVLVLEPGGAAEDLDVVAQQLVPDHLDLPADHVLRARQQVGDGDLALDPVARPVHVPLRESGEVQHRLP
jgi:hypothetical protein